ncbi:substrate-binding domain-containing protein [Longirhabdus pacifica]|uniref:substrate-binding domain-containing protein n=1 Tax=Longirhabdus pacifica TaxID=2305227 RepID=UPI001008C4E5|nr:substrate-binding domain-containing protein [Longirhabdus pacifica]
MACSSLEAIGEECNQYDYSMLILQTNYDPKKEAKFFDMLKHRIVDGLIFGSSVLSSEKVESTLSQNKIVLCESCANKSIPHVFVDHSKGMRMAMEHLMHKGHTHIGLCIGNPLSGVGVVRKQSFLQLLKKNRLEWKDAWFFKEKFTVEDGIALAKEMMSMEQLPTAFVVGSDQVAAGMMYELKRQHVQIPQDIAIVGFDNQPIAKVTGLTTIYQPIQEVGRNAVTLLYNVVHHENIPYFNELEMKLIERDTT